MIPSRPLQRIPAADSAVIRHSIQQRTPVLVTGLTERWPARQWTFESLRSDLEGKEVRVLADLPRDSGVLANGQKAHERTMPFGAFVDRALGAGAAPCYLANHRAGDLLPDWQSAADFESLTGPQREPTDTRLWIGSANTCSGLHSDLKDNLFVQLHGTKLVYLVPFAQSHLVYPFIDNLVNSEVDPEAYDAKRHPKLAQATVYGLAVSPGDVLFIPRGWWHYLRSETPSISINHWFGPPVSSAEYLSLLLRLGPSRTLRAVIDMVRYAVLGAEYKRTFFFSPASTGERLYNLLRHGDFSMENDPTK